jgi:hypothetical protein
MHCPKKNRQTSPLLDHPTQRFRNVSFLTEPADQMTAPRLDERLLVAGYCPTRLAGPDPQPPVVRSDGEGPLMVSSNAI